MNSKVLVIDTGCIKIAIHVILVLKIKVLVNEINIRFQDCFTCQKGSYRVTQNLFLNFSCKG